MINRKLIDQLSAKQFSYHLPEEKIAYFPLENRGESRLLVYKNHSILDDSFHNIIHHIDPQTTIIFNQSRVINARLIFYKETGAAIEIFCIKPVQSDGAGMNAVLNARRQVYWECLVGGKKRWKNRSEALYIDKENHHALKAYIHEESADSTVIRFEWDGEETFNEILLRYGHTPLPPYIKRTDTELDKDRYQTVFGREFGSVAAPTASLHFTEPIMKVLNERKVRQLFLTLHVGAGTFLPMKDEWVKSHIMHEEIIECSVKFIEELIHDIQRRQKILAVGTTAARTLESLYWLGVKLYMGIEVDWDGVGLMQWEAYELAAEDIDVPTSLETVRRYLATRGKRWLVTQTQLLIVPGYTFKIVDILQTNFHQPESTLLMLVSAFAGADNIREIYSHALKNDYRFLSYGDCSLIFK